MKIVRVSGIILALAVLAVAAGVRFHPSTLILFERNVQIRSPLCTLWKASLDGPIKLQQQEAQKRLAEASHVVQKRTAWFCGPHRRVNSGFPETIPILFRSCWHKKSVTFTERASGVFMRETTVLDIGAYIGTWTRQALARGREAGSGG